MTDQIRSARIRYWFLNPPTLYVVRARFLHTDTAIHYGGCGWIVARRSHTWFSRTYFTVTLLSTAYLGYRISPEYFEGLTGSWTAKNAHVNHSHSSGPEVSSTELAGSVRKPVLSLSNIRETITKPKSKFGKCNSVTIRVLDCMLVTVHALIIIISVVGAMQLAPAYQYTNPCVFHLRSF